MKTTELIIKLQNLLEEHGDLEVTMTEVIWVYTTVNDAVFVEDPYYDHLEPVICLKD